MTKYIRNDVGGIHSVENSFVLPNIGWSFIKEDEARAENPDLFGGEKAEKAAPKTTKTAKE